MNDQPTSISLSSNVVAENSQKGTIIGNLGTTDEDSGQSHTFSIVSTIGMYLVFAAHVLYCNLTYNTLGDAMLTRCISVLHRKPSILDTVHQLRL